MQILVYRNQSISLLPFSFILHSFSLTLITAANIERVQLINLVS